MKVTGVHLVTFIFLLQKFLHLFILSHFQAGQGLLPFFVVGITDQKTDPGKDEHHKQDKPITKR